jgi:hypothetical protein
MPSQSCVTVGMIQPFSRVSHVSIELLDMPMAPPIKGKNDGHIMPYFL